MGIDNKAVCNTTYQSSPVLVCCIYTSTAVVTSWHRHRPVWRHPLDCRWTEGSRFAPCLLPWSPWQGSATRGWQAPTVHSWCSPYDPRLARIHCTDHPAQEILEAHLRYLGKMKHLLLTVLILSLSIHTIILPYQADKSDTGVSHRDTWHVMYTRSQL